MTVKEYIDAIVKLSAEHTEAVEQLKKAVEELIEQHKPTEPLIKDEKIRKAVKVWADASGVEKVTSYGDYFWIGFVSENTDSVWKFECNYKDASEFKYDKQYTIAELCGEE